MKWASHTGVGRLARDWSAHTGSRQHAGGSVSSGHMEVADSCWSVWASSHVGAHGIRLVGRGARAPGSVDWPIGWPRWWVHHLGWWYIYTVQLFSAYAERAHELSKPLCAEKNYWKKENHVRSGFCGSVPLIGAVTPFKAVGYNGDRTSFATYLTSLTDIQIWQLR
jgi:hypothetical protein